VPCGTREQPLLRPTPVAIHDDRDMSGEAVLLTLGYVFRLHL
jgi:hypothetical protein